MAEHYVTKQTNCKGVQEKGTSDTDIWVKTFFFVNVLSIEWFTLQ